MRFWTRQFALCTSKLDSLTGLGPSKRLCCRAPIEHADRESHKGFLIRRWDLITAPDLCVQTFPLQRHFEDTLFLKSLFRVCMEFYIRLRSPAWEQLKFSYWIIVTNVEPYSLLLEVPQRWLPNRNKLFRELFMEQISTTWTWIAVDEWRNPAWYESCDLNHIHLFDDQYADGDGSTSTPFEPFKLQTTFKAVLTLIQSLDQTLNFKGIPELEVQIWKCS